MPQKVIGISARRDSGGAFLSAKPIVRELSDADLDEIKKHEDKEIAWLAERLLPMYLEYCNQKHEQPAKVDEIERRKSCIT